VTESDQRPEANRLVEQVTRSFGLETTLPTPGAPWEEHLRDHDAFAAALRSAGLRGIDLDARVYRWTFTVDDFLAGWDSQSRYLRHTAGARWEESRVAAATALRERFGDTICSMGSVWIATASKR
jgi:hypothetical protein